MVTVANPQEVGQRGDRWWWWAHNRSWHCSPSNRH